MKRISSGTPPFSQASCGKEHCQTCSGVYKANKQPVKFQVCIGDPECPETMAPCPQQDLKMYVPAQMIPRCIPGPSGDNETGQCGEDEKLQDYEVHIPGQTEQFQADSQQQNSSEQAKAYLDPCGDCDACQYIQKRKPRSSNCEPSPQPCIPPPKPQEWEINGHKYTCGNILANVKKPFRSNVRK
jgi:hypothetical protein